MKKLGFVVLALAVGAGFGACNRAEWQHHEPVDRADMPAMPAATKGDIIDVATGENMAEVTTLVQLVKAAGLVDTLKGTGPYTVFAPTNAAFAKLPAGTVESLLKPENKAKLVKILIYHVVKGNLTAADLAGKTRLPTVEGQDMEVEKDKMTGMWTVGNDEAPMANVTKADIHASNGTIHWIDSVLMPE